MKRLLSLLVLMVLMVSCSPKEEGVLGLLNDKVTEITSFHQDIEMKILAPNMPVQRIVINGDFIVNNKEFKSYYNHVEQADTETEVYYDGEKVHLFRGNNEQVLDPQEQDYASTYFALVENIKETYEYLEEETLDDGSVKLSFTCQNDELFQKARVPFNIDLGNITSENTYVTLNYTINPEGYLTTFNQLFEGSLEGKVVNFFIESDFMDFNNVDPIEFPESMN